MRLWHLSRFPCYTMSVTGSCILVESLDVDREGTRILSALTLSVSCGERLIIAGPNGAGKTTLLKVLLGILKKSGGSGGRAGKRGGLP